MGSGRGFPTNGDDCRSVLGSAPYRTCAIGAWNTETTEVRTSLPLPGRVLVLVRTSQNSIREFFVIFNLSYIIIGMKKDFEITYRKLTNNEIDQLFSEIKKTPDLTSYTKAEWGRLGRIFVAEISGSLIGICAASYFNNDWVEIGVIYVLEKYRGEGVGSALFKKAYEYYEKDKNIFMVSRNPAVIYMMKKKKMDLTGNFLKLPWSVKIHILKFIFSLYRIKEYFRKNIGRIKSPFIFGLKQ
jgi:GNAT superfamily N-acetyltransferase